jgi:hypothetical protein
MLKVRHPLQGIDSLLPPQSGMREQVYPVLFHDSGQHGVVMKQPLQDCSRIIPETVQQLRAWMNLYSLTPIVGKIFREGAKDIEL